MKRSKKVHADLNENVDVRVDDDRDSEAPSAKITNDAIHIVDGVNLHYLYSDGDIALLQRLFLEQANLRLSNSSRGMVLDAQGQLYVANGVTFSVGNDIGLDGNRADLESKLDLIKEAVKELCSTSFVIQNHLIVLPINVQNSHWCLSFINVKILRDADSIGFDHEIKIYVCDSLGKSKHTQEMIANIARLLGDIFCENLYDKNKQANMHSEFLETARQPDNYSCGVLTVYTAVRAVLGSSRYEGKKLTEADIVTIRKLHMDLAGAEFDARQRLNLNVTLADKAYTINSQDKLSLRIELIKYVAQDENFYAMIRDFCMAETKLEKLNTEFNANVVVDWDDIYKKSSDSTAAIKSWFAQHYQELYVLGVVQKFFAPRVAQEELSWIDDGKDSLVHFLHDVYLMHDPRSTVHIQTSNLSIDQITANSELEFVSVASNVFFYKFEGMIKSNGRAHGKVSESFRNGLDTFEGEFIDGIRESGTERTKEVGSGIELRFAGKYDQNGRFFDGQTKCILGDKCSIGKYLSYEGSIVNGVACGYGTIRYLDNPENRFLDIISDEDSIEQIDTEFSIPEVRVILDHFEKYCSNAQQNHLRLSCSIHTPTAQDYVRKATIAKFSNERVAAAQIEIPLQPGNENTDLSAERLVIRF